MAAFWARRFSAPCWPTCRRASSVAESFRPSSSTPMAAHSTTTSRWYVSAAPELGISEPRTQRSGVSGGPLTPLRCVRGSENYLELRAAGGAWERNDVAEVGHAAQEHQRALQAKAEAGEREGAVAAQGAQPPVRG